MAPMMSSVFAGRPEVDQRSTHKETDPKEMSKVSSTLAMSSKPSGLPLLPVGSHWKGSLKPASAPKVEVAESKRAFAASYSMPAAAWSLAKAMATFMPS